MFFVENGSFNPTQRGFYLAIVWAIFTDILSTYFFKRTYPKSTKLLASYFKKNIKFDNKVSLFSKGANHLKGWEGVGGKLFLTDKQLIFKSHKFNIQNHEQGFDLSRINKVENPSGKRLNFEYEGKLEKFVVEEPEKWVEKLKSP